ncbi:MAG TPA: multiheme c-type cytochrome [Thermoanaerobaculia bacterium]|nr:multiheme c-type cytochrome [Thermoanaerobaculia bacterium]
MKTLPASIAAIALCATVAAPQAQAQQPRYLGVASCAYSGCHGGTEPLQATSVLQNEYYTWLNRDRHAQAYNVLFDERSTRIARNMRLRTKAWEAAICLDCHTTHLPDSAVEGTVDREDGVQCEACHGPASGWRDEHAEPGWTHEQSVAAGMIDLRDIVRRASLCVGCHVGDARKEVGHELIASGHPVLTFELDNYTASMPPHWKPGPETAGIEAWAVGQVVKFRQSLENLARHAEGETWPEFADMDCGSCHHSLRDSEWRQERGWPGRAGLPSWSPQHWAVLRLVIGHVAPSIRSELDPLVADLGAAVARMEKGGVAGRARRARALVDAALPRVTAARWSPQDVRALMRAIAGDQQTILAADIQAAEQAALSLHSLATVLTSRNPLLLRSPMVRAIDQLFVELRARNDYDARRFAARLAELQPLL